MPVDTASVVLDDVRRHPGNASFDGITASPLTRDSFLIGRDLYNSRCQNLLMPILVGGFMSNEGMGHCASCAYFDANASHCTLREVPIESAHWTTCLSRNTQSVEAEGPVYAIVCEVKDGVPAYDSIPYFDGCRADTVKPADGGDTVIRLVDSQGISHEFATVADYMAFYETAPRAG